MVFFTVIDITTGLVLQTDRQIIPGWMEPPGIIQTGQKENQIVKTAFQFVSTCGLHHIKWLIHLVLKVTTTFVRLPQSVSSVSSIKWLQQPQFIIPSV